MVCRRAALAAAVMHVAAWRAGPAAVAAMAGAAAEATGGGLVEAFAEAGAEAGAGLLGGAVDDARQQEVRMRPRDDLASRQRPTCAPPRCAHRV